MIIIKNKKCRNLQEQVQKNMEDIHDINKIPVDDKIEAKAEEIMGVVNPVIDNVDYINSLIPEQASETNQLADKDFVNSSIASNTANFRGTYTSESLLPQIGNTPNDYAFVETTDNQGNTIYKRFKWSNNEWLFEYDLNNSSFTASQWNTINSGVTSSILTDVSNLAIGLEGKQDAITSTNKLPANNVSGLSPVATSGSYDDLSNKPSVIQQAKYLESWYTNKSQTYGNTYRMYPWWESNNICKLTVDGYDTKVDRATKDSNGNTITTTYATNTSVNQAIELQSQAINAIGEGVTDIAEELSNNYYTSATIDSTFATKAELPNLAPVATSGNYNDLSNKPTIPSIVGLATSAEVQAVSNKLNTFLGTDTTTLSGLKDLISAAEESDEISALTTALGNKQDKITSTNKLSASNVSGLATVATSGSYNDLTDKPEGLDLPTILKSDISTTTKTSLALTQFPINKWIFVKGLLTFHARTYSQSSQTGGTTQNSNKYLTLRPGTLFMIISKTDSTTTKNISIKYYYGGTSSTSDVELTSTSIACDAYTQGYNRSMTLIPKLYGIVEIYN